MSTTPAGRTMVAAAFAIVALAFGVTGTVIAVAGHHPLRALGSLLAGAVFAAATWFALKYRPSGNVR